MNPLRLLKNCDWNSVFRLRPKANEILSIQLKKIIINDKFYMPPVYGKLARWLNSKESRKTIVHSRTNRVVFGTCV